MGGKAFTLIELLIVVAIIGILAAIAVPNFLNAQVRAKVVATESNMKTVITANEIHRLDYGTYSPFADSSTVSFKGSIGGFVHLTTPTPYLSSHQAVIDPFAARFESGLFDSDREYDKTLDYNASLGHRALRDDEIFQTQGGEYYSNLAANSFMLEGVGPDKLDSIFMSSCFTTGCQFTIFAIYDPSNGLHSNGDIVRVVGCVIPELRGFFE
ncbi:MAG: prepilin-type N-terminal cleavage/methylation domain-containing protein [bacterium]